MKVDSYPTNLPAEDIVSLAKELFTIPLDKVTPHRTVANTYKDRLQSIMKGEGINYGTAEALAYGSLLKEGNCIRLSGQDVNRGTFTHRHSRIYDVKKYGQ